jgi:ABC-type lipoprotein release transport system permease subunit
MASLPKTMTMFVHLLRLACRNFRRNKAYSIVNVAGLSVGLCACICIYTIVRHEFSFDRWHPGASRIYRVLGELTQSTGDRERFMVLPPVVLRYGQGQLTGVEAVGGAIPISTEAKTVEAGIAVKASEIRTAALVQPGYFDVFSYDWLAGDRHSALKEPFTVVLTRRRAEQFFGRLPPEQMIGRVLVYSDSLRVRVTGVVKDWAGNTDLPFTDLLSYSTIEASFLQHQFSPDGWTRPDMAAWIFLKLSKGAVAANVETQLARLIERDKDPGVNLVLRLESLAAVHFDAGIIENPIRTAHLPTLYGLMVMAAAMLVLAVINFINLSTAYSLQRTREVGLRKILGGGRAGLVSQFLVESFLLVLFATGIAVALVNVVLGAFRSFIPEGVHFHIGDWSTVGFLLALISATVLLAGWYPARVASAALPVLRLRGGNGERGSEKWVLRRALIVLQFSISLVFIIGSLVISKQLRFTQHKDLGFTSHAIVNIDIPPDSLIKLKTLQQMVLGLTGVENATKQWVSPMTDNTRGMKLKFASGDVKDFWVVQVAGDEHFIPMYGIKLLAGTNLFAADSVHELVINEALARKMGYRRPGQALGKMLYWNDRPYPVVGVVADFHTQSLHGPINPTCIINRGDREFKLAVRLSTAGGDASAVAAALERIERAWKKEYPGQVWGYRFYDETLGKLYEQDRRTAILVNVAVGLTVFISGIGLFGLALFMAQRRAKEISIRKVLGATAGNLLMLLCGEIVKLVLIALLIAAPLAYYLVSRWLRGFAYHIDVGPGVFLLAGLVAVGIALSTVSVQAVRAATANPIKQLRED